MIVTAAQESSFAGRHMEYLEDPEGKLTFEDIGKEPWSGKFRPWERDIVNLSFSRSAFWMRMTLQNGTGTAQELFLDQDIPWIDSIDVYITKADGSTDIRKSGEKYPFGQREILNSRFLFRLNLAPGEAVKIAIRVQSLDPMQLPFIVWKKEALAAHDKMMSAYLGVVFGCLTAVMLYNLMLFFSLGDRTYLYYVLYILSLEFMIFTYFGYSFQYFWPNSPRLQNWMVFPAGYLAMFVAVNVVKSFLDTARGMPRVHKAFTVFQGLCVALPLYGLLVDDYLFTSASCAVVALIFPFLMGGAGAVAYMNKVRSARFFILAWASSLVGQVMTIGTLFGLFPPYMVYRRMMEVGYMFDAIFLSFALADKIRILRREKEVAEDLAMAALKKSRDTLEAKVAERTAELSREKEKAEEATLLKDKFVGLVSHDLRSPLASIITMLDHFGGEAKKEDGELNKRLASMASNTAHGMMDMIDNLLDLSRLRTGAIKLSKKRINAHEMTERMIRNTGFWAIEKGVVVENRLPREFTLFADPDLFGEALANLLSNAVKFSHKGGQVAVFNPDGAPGTLAVKDAGTGIPPEIAGRLFDRTTKTSRLGTNGEKGTGLGLTFCHDIIAAHGGSIHVESEPGKGSVFTLILPPANAVVLIADDRPLRRLEIKKLMSGLGGVAYLEAGDGMEAAKIVEESAPDLVVAGVPIYGMSGAEFLALIRRACGTNRILVIVAATVGPEGVESARRTMLEMGADDFVALPLAPEEFIRVITRYLPQGGARRAQEG